MKAILANLIFLFVWVVIGHFMPTINLRFAFIIFPILYVVSAKFLKYEQSIFLIVPFSFLLILANDFLFRIYGGGNHDDAGRGWCELIFYITLFTTTISIFYVAHTMTKEKMQNKILLNLCYVLVCSVASYLLFRKFSVNI